ncbi:uncharacterized protein LOC106065314 isoform X2 [Biomphalaria glabrata]|uniref:Uncharacterized protein LOC106065314 isoform X2 n=1 Tax=Biomphalaria glabrata TaxID=6526 RepID=A0A9W2YBP8_BIOGL|nr:uncharacterized protein LOC106065314 isoform X2 [Biomphalaria glabrata]
MVFMLMTMKKQKQMNTQICLQVMNGYGSSQSTLPHVAVETYFRETHPSTDNADKTNALEKFYYPETEVKDQRKIMISLQHKLKDQSKIEECLEILLQGKEEHCEKIELLAEFALSLKCNWEKLASENTKLHKRKLAQMKKIEKNFEQITLKHIQESHSKECDMFTQKIELQEFLKISQDKKNKWKEKAQESDKKFQKLLTEKVQESDGKSQKILTKKDDLHNTLKIIQHTADDWKRIAKANEAEIEKLITEKERLQNEIKEVTFEKNKLETSLANTQTEFSTLIFEKADLENSLRKMKSDRAQSWHGILGDICHIKFFPTFEEARTKYFSLICMLLLITIFISVVLAF